MAAKEDGKDASYEEARDLAEKALGEYAEGRDGKADALAEKAKATNPKGAEDVVRDLDEDAKATGEG